MTMKLLFLAVGLSLFVPAPEPKKALSCKEHKQYHIFDTQADCTRECPCKKTCSFWANYRAGDSGDTDKWYCECPC